jgi:hypothetical protein
MEGCELSMVASDMAGAVMASQSKCDATAPVLVENLANYWSAARFEDFLREPVRFVLRHDGNFGEVFDRENPIRSPEA